jgi:hypothetical protein
MYRTNRLFGQSGPAPEEPPYPYQDLIKLLGAMDYIGWVCLEASGTPSDPIRALIEQRELLAGMVAKAQAERLG